MNITAAVESWTPAMARVALDNNHVNRNPRMNVAEAYRRDMEEGRWVMTGEPIQIGENGALLNGQHRLIALSGSSCGSIDFLVVRGVDDKSQVLMDQGSARSISDMIKLEHGSVKNAMVVASISRWMAISPTIDERFGQLLKGKVSAALALDAFRNNSRDIIRAAEKGVHLRNTTLAISPTALGYCWLQFDWIDKEACQQFFYAFQELAFNTTGDPRKAAYQRIVKIMADPDAKAGNWTSVSHVSVLTRAWNAWRKGEQVDTITIRNKDGLIPPVHPV